MMLDQLSKFVTEFVLVSFVSLQIEQLVSTHKGKGYPSSFIVSGTITPFAICYVPWRIECPANIKIYIDAAVVVLIYYVSLLKINLSYIWLAIFPFMVLVFIGALCNELSHQSGSQRRDNGEAHSRSIRTGTTGNDAEIPYLALCLIGRYCRDDSFIVSQFLLFLSSTLGALTLMMARLAPTATGVAPGIATASELLRKASLVVLLVTVHTMAAEFLGEDVVLFCLPELVPVLLWFSLHVDRGSSIINVDEIKSRKNWLIALGAVLAPAFAYLAPSMDESVLSWCTRTSVSFGVSGLLISYVVFMLCQWPGQAGTVTTTLKEAVQLLKFWANVLLIAAAVLLVFTSLAAARLGLHGPRVATLAKSFDDYVPRFSN